MDFDEYDYLEKTVEGADARKDKDHRKSSSEANGEKRDERGRDRSDRRDKDRERGREKDPENRRDREKDWDRERDREKDRGRERDRGREKERDPERERDRGREKDRGRERDREREKEMYLEGEEHRDRRSRDRDYKEDKEKQRVRESSRRSSSRSRHDREVEREMESSRRSSSRSRHDREVVREVESSRRSSSRSRHDREVEREMERTRSRERVLREREYEMEIRERESRRFKDKKETMEPEADPERDQRTVFAYQMPLKATERDVYEFFSKAGKVRDVRLIMDRNSRRSKGVGYIEFYDAMSVPMAISLSGQPLLGQPVMVKPSEAEKNLVQSTATGGSGVVGAAAARKIYVGNLHFNITEDQLRQVFEPFGPVELVQLPTDLETGQCKGYGFVQFAQIEHAKAAQSLNGNLEIAGRVIKVSAVSDHITAPEPGSNSADFDDDDGGGLSLNARSRALLMQKLDRTGTASSIAESLGVPVVNGQAMLSTPSLPVPIGEPSECILLKNMFDPRTEMDPDFDLEIKDDVQEECSKLGPLKHIYVDKRSEGHVYLRFETVSAAASCQRAMHMRWFAGRAISATFMGPYEYDAKFGAGGFGG